MMSRMNFNTLVNLTNMNKQRIQLKIQSPNGILTWECNIDEKDEVKALKSASLLFFLDINNPNKLEVISGAHSPIN